MGQWVIPNMINSKRGAWNSHILILFKLSGLQNVWYRRHCSVHQCFWSTNMEIDRCPDRAQMRSYWRSVGLPQLPRIESWINLIIQYLPFLVFWWIQDSTTASTTAFLLTTLQLHHVLPLPLCSSIIFQSLSLSVPYKIQLFQIACIHWNQLARFCLQIHVLTSAICPIPLYKRPPFGAKYALLSVSKPVNFLAKVEYSLAKFWEFFRCWLMVFPGFPRLFQVFPGFPRFFPPFHHPKNGSPPVTLVTRQPRGWATVDATSVGGPLYLEKAPVVCHLCWWRVQGLYQPAY